MTNKVADQFVDALRKLEETGDVNGIATLFDENSEVGNVTSTENFHGTDGARQFWSNHRETLGDPRSRFRNKVITHETAALEWTTEGNSRGHEFRYHGVSILETKGDKITRFFAYFDAGKLGDQLGGSPDGR